MEKLKGLKIPSGAVTSSSAAVIWEKSDCTGFDVYVDGEKVSHTTKSCYTAEELSGGTHSICVVGYSNGAPAAEDTVEVFIPKDGGTVNICDCGAVGDGTTMNTQAFQRAVELCPENGTVYVPAGIYLTGAFSLKSNMRLFVDENAVILGSDKTEDYPVSVYRFEGLEQPCYASLINADGCENIVIEGHGTINANGVLLRKNELEKGEGKPGRAICIRKCTNVYLKDIAVRQSPAWCVHTVYCTNVTLNGVKIHTKYDENGNKYKDIVNGDGFDPDSCKNVYVFNSLIASQDDCIAIKSGRNEEGRKVGIPTEHVRVFDCVFKSGFGVVVGSEMSGGVRDVVVRGCEFDGAYSIAAVKPPRGRGNVIEDILYENCTLKNINSEHHDCEWFRGAISLDMFYSHVNPDFTKAENIDDGTPTMRNITLRSLDIDTDGGNAIFIAGLPESRIQKVTLENIHVHGKYGLKAYNTDGLVMKNVTVEQDEGESFEIYNCTDVTTK